MSLNQSVLIRDVTMADVPALSALAAHTFIDTFGHLYELHHLAAHLEKTCSISHFSSALAQGDMLLAAFNQDRFIGYIKSGKLALPVAHATPHAAELHRLYVLPEYKGLGVSQMLIEEALGRPKLREATSIYLGVYAENLRAQRFYARYGFSIIGEYTYYVGPHADREYIMQRVNA